MTWKTALTRAIQAEVSADRAADLAEENRRKTWWDTTWALAAVPRAEWAEAAALYVQKTKHTKGTANNRRRVGGVLPQVHLGMNLPMPRFAQAVVDWIGKDGDETKVGIAVGMLTEAEREGMSLREFSQMLTGRSWTNTPEDMTEADEDAVVERVARKRPEKIARVVRMPAVAKKVARDPASRSAVRTEELSAIREDPPAWVAENRAEAQARKGQTDAAFGEVYANLDPEVEHPIESDLKSALMWMRAAVKHRRELGQGNEAQEQRIASQADHISIAVEVVRDLPVSDDEIQALLEAEG